VGKTTGGLSFLDAVQQLLEIGLERASTSSTK
jgi:hypothetical protein